MATNDENPYAKWAPKAAPVAASDDENPYAKWAAPAEATEQTPIGRALAQRQQEVAAFQAQKQQEYADRLAAIKAQEAANPDDPYGVPQFLRDEAERPPVDRLINQRRPPLEAREEAPSKPLGSGFSAAAQLALVDNPTTKRKILAQTLFPNDPQGIWRVGFDSDGQPVYVGDDNKLHRIATGTQAFGAQLAANSPEMVASAIGALGGPGVAAGMAAGVHGIKRGIAGLYYMEPQTTAGNLEGMATEGLATLAGEGIGRGISTVANRGRVIDFTPQDMAKAEAVRQQVKNTTGIDLDLAQASGDRRLIALRAYVARYPGASANLVQAADEAQKGQLHAATERVLNTIANATPAEVAGQEGINAAQVTIDAARRAAETRVDPLYRAAYEAAPAVMDPSVVRFFRHPEFREAYRRGQTIARLEEKEPAPVVVTTTRRVPEMPPMSVSEVPQMRVRDVTPASPPTKAPAIAADQRRLGYEPPPAGPPGTDIVPASPQPGRDLIVNAEGEIAPRTRRYERSKTPAGYRMREIVDQEEMTVPDLRALDYTKRGLDQMIESLKASGQRQQAAALAWQKRRFVRALDGLDIPQYKAARKAWANELRDTINPLEKGVVGVLSRIKDPQASKAAARIFADPNLTETMITTAKNAIQPRNPEAWDQLTRTWIAHRWNQAQTVTQTGQELNAAGKFHQQLFGNPTRRANTVAMLNRPAADALDNVMEAASHLASTPIAGSNTFRDQETKEIFQGLTGAGFKIADAIRQPFQTMRTAAQRRAVEQATRAVAEGILDPTKRKQLRVVLKMKPSTRRTIVMFNVLGAQTAKDYLKSQMSQGEDSHLIAEDAEDANAVSEQ